MTDVNDSNLNEDEDIERFKGRVEDIFESLMIEKRNQDKKKISYNSSEKCIEKAYEELEFIRTKFIEFQDSISELAIAEYVMPAIEQFAIYAASISQVLNDDYIDEEIEMNEIDKRKLKDLKKFKAQILSSINNRYKL